MLDLLVKIQVLLAYMQFNMFQACKINGLLATAKHFPGHGDTETDSHSSLAMIPSDSSRLWEIEIPPFQDMIEKGIDAINGCTCSFSRLSA